MNHQPLDRVDSTHNLGSLPNTPLGQEVTQVRGAPDPDPLAPFTRGGFAGFNRPVPAQGDISRPPVVDYIQTEHARLFRQVSDGSDIAGPPGTHPSIPAQNESLHAQPVDQLPNEKAV